MYVLWSLRVSLSFRPLAVFKALIKCDIAAFETNRVCVVDKLTDAYTPCIQRKGVPTIPTTCRSVVLLFSLDIKLILGMVEHYVILQYTYFKRHHCLLNNSISAAIYRSCTRAWSMLYVTAAMETTLTSCMMSYWRHTLRYRYVPVSNGIWTLELCITTSKRASTFL